jgi:hypothetical protein
MNEERDVHPEKHCAQRISTVPGIQIDVNDEQPQNIPDSIRINLDRDSKTNEESEQQEQKHSEPRISTEDGIEMDLNDPQEPNA